MGRGAPRGCDVARKATWQRHADPRSAPTWRVDLLYIFLYFIIYKRGFCPPLIREGHTLNNRRAI